MSSRQINWQSSMAYLFASGLILLALSGCSMKSMPAVVISQAEVAVWEASESRAPQYAPLELRLAREKLEGAKQALKVENFDLARRLGEQALVDAKLAKAKADSQFARQNADELQKTIEALRIEAERVPLGY
jgi:hypothetical protein